MFKRTATRIAFLLIVLTLSTAAPAEEKTITPNYKDADIAQIIEAVSAITGKTFLIDPRVRGVSVNMISQKPMTTSEFYQIFLSILQVHGFVAVPAGKVIKILPDTNARALPGNDLPDHVGDTDELVTQVIPVKNINAGQVATILRPFVATQGNIVAYLPSNTIILVDRANNVNRIMKIINRIDQAGDDELDVIPLQNATAAEMVRMTNQLFTAAAPAEGGAPLKMVADDRTNSVIISGEKSQRLRLKTLVAYLDTPVSSGGGTQVRYLRFADAEKVAALLKDQATAAVSVAGAPPTGASAGGGASQLAKDVTILADAATNALIITAPPKVMTQLMNVIDKLDIRRAQVQVEAIIVEVTQDKSAELGVNWAAFSQDDDTRIPVGGFLSQIGGASIVDLAKAIDNPASAPAALANGTTIGIGRISASGVNFGAMLRALQGDGNSNVLATPSATTMDNQEAEFNATQEVPFITGSFTSTNGNNNGTVNPFQTVQRQEVGTKLKVTPQIAAEGNSVVLKLYVESSSVAQQSVSNVDITVNKRAVTTNVLIEDGGIVVLGGLISDEATHGEQRVPYLGRIPLIGLAFKTRNARARKTNLMIFIRPKILRDAADTAILTNSKYNYMREEQRKDNRREVLPLLPGVPRPKLPEAPPVPPKTETPAPTTPAEKEKAGKENQETGESSTQTPPPQPPPQAPPNPPPQ